MHTLTVKLKQHTPLIHFQHDQEGATLRASEVKPKLDKFILGKLTQAEKEKGIKAGWIKTKNDRTWLDYKMRITAKGKSFSKGIKIINADKTAIFQEHIVIDISTTNSNLVPIIRQYICEFFIIHNFGFRESKGYGSYTVTHLDDESVTLPENVSSILKRTYTGGVASFPFTPIPDNGSIVIDLRKYHRRINVREKEIRDRIKGVESVTVKIDSNHFNQSLVFGNYQQAIKTGIEKRIDEIKNDSNALRPYAQELSKSMAFACRERLDDIHSDFRYSYFSQLLEETISRKFQCYKSGCRYPRYKKSQLRDFFGRINGDTNVVYWDKRYIKQQINRLSASEKGNLTLKCCNGRHQSQCELNYQDQQSRAYLYIRALLGLEGNFEFLTNSKEKDDKFIIAVNHDENDPEKVIERFQSIIIFKVIDGQIYVCLKPKQELRKILGKRFTFQFSVKERQSDNSPQWPISTPVLSDQRIDQLYTDICQKIKNL